MSFRARTFGPKVLRPALVVAFLALGAREAEARSGGIAAGGCSGCHRGGVAGSLTLTATPPTFAPGDRVELTVDIVGQYANGGVFVTTGSTGQLEAPANAGLTKVTDGLVHNQPKASSDGKVRFTFAWVAPTQPGGVRFSVYALGGNANRASSGDTGFDGQFDFVYGCTGKTFYLDSDTDGVGREDFSILGCAGAPPPSYVESKGDCDDYRNTTYPGAKELCNTWDDDCDGEVDEDAVPVELWPDADGDGYYGRAEQVGEAKIGCAGLKGYAAEGGDCQPMNADVHPRAEEVCNNQDDDCDGEVDERVRPTCGEGWCRRESPGCDVSTCLPGQPMAEVCNFLDDDCDGEVDEGSNLCEPGKTCAAGTCVDSSQVGPMPGAGATAGTVNGSSGNAGSSSAGTGAGGDSPSSSTSEGSGCALGPRTSHGALAVLLLAGASRALRRRRKLS